MECVYTGFEHTDADRDRIKLILAEKQQLEDKINAELLAFDEKHGITLFADKAEDWPKKLSLGSDIPI